MLLNARNQSKIASRLRVDASTIKGVTGFVEASRVGHRHLHDGAHVLTRTESSQFDAPYNCTSSHRVARAADLSRSTIPCTPPAKRPSGTLAAPPYLRVRTSKLFGRAAYAILNELTYENHYNLKN
eukprot:4793038-Pleurochrysis_carterae.AAC.2